VSRFSVVFLIFSISTVYAGDLYTFQHHSQQRRFLALTKQFRCLVCQNEDLASSSAALADDLRNKIYRMLISGKNNDQIISYMTKRYGNFILLKPPFSAETYILWFLPFFLLLLLLGTAVVIFILRRQKSLWRTGNSR